MKTLKIYKNDEGEFVLERTNEFDHATKRLFISEEGLLEGLESYPDGELSKYDIQVSGELWATVIKHIQNRAVFESNEEPTPKQRTIEERWSQDELPNVTPPTPETLRWIEEHQKDPKEPQ